MFRNKMSVCAKNINQRMVWKMMLNLRPKMNMNKIFENKRLWLWIEEVGGWLKDDVQLAPCLIASFMYGCYYHFNNLCFINSNEKNLNMTCSYVLFSSGTFKCRLFNLLLDHPMNRPHRLYTAGIERAADAEKSTRAWSQPEAEPGGAMKAEKPKYIWEDLGTQAPT